eukprot:13074146-Ditylum_brightwellii.AAC.1
MHLTPLQRKQLQAVLEKTPELFNGELGLYPHRKVHLEVEENVRPYHAKAYSVPRVHLDVFKKELMHIVAIGVLRPCGPTKWAAGTFIIPKKDGRVRWVSDFWELNRVLKRRVYPLPIIQEVMQRQTGYK